MKIILFLNSDLHAATALSLLSPELQKHQIRIILSKKVGKTDGLAPELLELKNHEQTDIDSIFPKLATKLNAEIISYDNVNSTFALQDFQSFAPDLFISIRFGQIFKQPLIDIPKYGVLNLHSAILPDYRGIMGTFWAILNDEEKIGATLHFINDAGIDTGDVIAISEEKIDRDSSLIANINKIYIQGCANILRVLEEISAGKSVIKRNQENMGSGRYFTYPAPDNVKHFLTKMPFTKSQDVSKILERLKF